MAEFKNKAEAASTPAHLWEIEDLSLLSRDALPIDETFDYRYSRLLMVFVHLIREGYLDESRLAGLSEEKLELVRKGLAWTAEA